MSSLLRRAFGTTVVAGWILLTLGCASSGTSTVHYGYYAGDYWHDPYYGRCCYGDVDIDVDRDRPDNRPPGARPRPPGARPPGTRPRPPIARPPGMRPPGGMPSRPRPHARPGRRR